MGWCHEFGVTVREACGHPMTAGESACRCQVCGVVCEGQFNGCATVWANGPREVVLIAPDDAPLLRATEPAPATELVSEVVVEEVPEEPPLIRTAWPATAGPTIAEPVLRVIPAAPSGSGAPGAPVPTPPPPPAPQLQPQPAQPARDEDERVQVFEWLQDSFDGVRSQLRVLSDAVNRQQQTLDSLADARAAAERVSELADVLPERIGEAIHEAVTTGRRQPDTTPDQGNGEVLLDLRDSAEDEAPPNGASARPVASSLAAAPSEPAPDRSAPSRSSADQDEPGMRTQLTALASTVQDRVNRSNWQETLRSLAHWPPEGR